MSAAFVAPATGIGRRAFAWSVLALFLGLALTGVATPLGPAVPVALVLTLAGLAITLGSTWHGLLVVLAAVMLVPVPFSVSLGPVTVSAGRALIFALVAGWLIHRGRLDSDGVPRTPVGGPLLVLIAAMGTSTIVNVPRMAGFELAGAFRKLGLYGIDFALLFLVAVTVVAGEDRILRLVRVLAGLVVVTAALGVVEFVTGRNVFEFLAPYLPGSVGRFIGDLADAAVLTRGRVTRVRSTLEHPLAFGSLLLLGLPLAIALCLDARERASRIRWGVGAVLIGSSILLTAGRSVYVIAGLSLFIMLLLLPEGRSRASILAVVAVVTLLFLGQRDVRDAMLAFFQPRQGGVLEGSIESRVADYGPVLERVGERPLLGFGPRSFAIDELKRSGLLPDPENLVLDNAYLGALAETGVVGLLALVGVLATAAVAAWRAARRARSPSMALIGLALFVSVLSFIFMGFAADVYLFNAPPRVFFVLLAAVCAARRLSGWPRDREEQRWSGRASS